MGDGVETCFAGTQVAGGIGALTGLAVGIWAAVEHLQPALEGVNGISKEGADWITAGICIFGGLEAFAGAGYCAGVIAFPLLLAAGACLAGGCTVLSKCCEGTTKRISACCTPFWQHEQAPAPRVTNVSQFEVDEKAQAVITTGPNNI